MTTVPGFSSRDTSSTIRQFPQRDEALMSTPGFSNTAPDHKSRVTSVEVASAVEDAESKVVEPEVVAPKKATRKPRAESK